MPLPRAPVPPLTSATGCLWVWVSGSTSAACRLWSSNRARVRAAWSSTSKRRLEVTRRKRSLPCMPSGPSSGHTNMGRQSSTEERPMEGPCQQGKVPETLPDRGAALHPKGVSHPKLGFPNTPRHATATGPAAPQPLRTHLPLHSAPALPPLFPAPPSPLPPVAPAAP